ncbi:MAG: DMT family transporter [Paracoccaceae bacterium]|nr:DMT family transporter [Paracoccaceae bacterium]MDG1739613.1 DMT family transporter [Paracoccaceae bacterium]MDG2258135.1 DMT family transporter [Paracoccaceae bacterium]
MSPKTMTPNLIGALCALPAAFFFSVNDMAIKVLSDGYALHQVVLIRSVIGMALWMLIALPFTGWQVVKTKRPMMHFARGFCVVFANMSFFLGLAVLPLAEAVSIFFISPLIITVFSVVFLGEKVGPWRWGAVAIGLAGVLVIVNPSGAKFQIATMLPLIAATSYAILHILTRKIGKTESAATMLFYIQLTFIMTSGAIGLALGDGRFSGNADPSLEFLTRSWTVPDMADWWIFMTIGVGSAAGGYLISQAYRLSEAAFAAPFEYLAMPLAILWGVLVFGEWPDMNSWVGMALIIGSGLVLLWREALGKRMLSKRSPRLRR